MNVTKEIETLHKRFKTLDPYELAEALGIIVHKMDLGNTRGFCYHSRRIKQIFLNQNLDVITEKFVLSHEIGHLIMHPNHNAHFLHSTFFSMDRYELEANKFAVNLLISDDELKEYKNCSIDELSMIFGLPQEIIWLRLK